MKQILLPTDLTFSIDNLIDLAIRLLDSEGGRIVLLYTYKARGGAATLVSIEAHMKEEAERDMQVLVKRLHERLPEGVTLDPQITYGAAAPTIARIADEEQFDLVIMSPEESSILRDIFSGSVTKAVIQEAASPVLAVPRSFKGGDMKRIVLAVDSQPLKNATVLNPLVQLVKEQGAELTVFHLVTETEDSGIHASVSEALKDTPHQTHLEENTEDLNQRLDDYAAERQVDMICMIHHERSLMQRIFQSSHSLKEAGRSTLPLLVLSEE